jgi:hypothetical protein
MRKLWAIGTLALAVVGLSVITDAGPARASSHMDAPLITRDPSANTTDVYAFRGTGEDGTEYLAVALGVYPFEEPGIGPNNYSFDDNVLYEIHVALGSDVAAGRPTLSYQFRFKTEFLNRRTTLQAFLGPIDSVFDGNQNLRQTYSVTTRDRRIPAHREPEGEEEEEWERSVQRGRLIMLGKGMVPPNNQGRVTPRYNQGDNGENPAKEGVASEALLDPYTSASIVSLTRGYRAFAGQRDDGFYADIHSIFDLDFSFSGPNKPFDSQGGFNIHTIVLQIPLSEIGSAAQAGVYATTSRRAVKVLSDKQDNSSDRLEGPWVQVGRQGNPLFNEALVALRDKDLYNRTSPTEDRRIFARYALEPELAAVLGFRATGRTDIAAIFIPDVIKVDLTTGPARLAGNPDDPGFHRLSVFGGDTLTNGRGATVAGGWPNGRRFGDDVLDIAVLALAESPINPAANVDGVTRNDITYNKVMPYAATPLNGRNHQHHGDSTP